MLEQCFQWRHELAAKQRGVEEDVSEVELAEVRTGVAAEFLDRLTAEGCSTFPDSLPIDRALSIWVAERRALRTAYETAQVEEAEWKTSPRDMHETRALDADRTQYWAALNSVHVDVDYRRWI
jgi:hypothetical protein